MGDPFGIDGLALAKELGFEGIINNSMAAVADRDFIIETLQWAATFMQHISCWSGDLIIYGTAESGFVRLADAYATGSCVFGHMAGLMMNLKGLPSTYNKDMQESWKTMLDSFETISDSVQIATGVLSTLAIFPDKMKAALTPDMLATDVADYLVRKGVPFKETYHINGRLVALVENKAMPMDELSLQQLQGVDPRFRDDVMSACDYTSSVEKRTILSITSEKVVLEQTTRIAEILK